MKPCPELEALFAQHPDVLRREIYRSHLETCGTCRAAEASFEAFSELVRQADVQHFHHPPSIETKLDLLDAMRLYVATRNRRFTAPVWIAAASLLLLVSATAAFFTTQRKATDTGDTVNTAVSVQRILKGRTTVDELSSFSLGRLLTGPGEQLSVRVNNDELQVAEQTNLGIVDTRESQTRVRLDRGTIHFEVQKRDAGGAFFVDASPYQVRVIGTRFSVTRRNEDDVTVSVSKGVVEVTGPHINTSRIAAGEQRHFSDERTATLLLSDIDSADESQLRETTLSAEIPVNIDSTSEKATQNGSRDSAIRTVTATARGPEAWRRMILAGAYEQVEDEILAHLDRRPRDWQSWALLADCLRKAGKYSRSVDSYQKVIHLAPASEANRARLTAGSLLQDRLARPRDAARLLEEYLQISKESSSIKAEIMVRLARAYIKTGRNDRAEPLLREVTNRHLGDPVAKKAEYLLSQIAIPSPN